MFQYKMYFMHLLSMWQSQGHSPPDASLKAWEDLFAAAQQGPPPTCWLAWQLIGFQDRTQACILSKHLIFPCFRSELLVYFHIEPSDTSLSVPLGCSWQASWSTGWERSASKSIFVALHWWSWRNAPGQC